MKCIRVFAILSLVFTASCNPTNAAPNGHVFSRTLFSAYQHRDASLSKKRTKLLFDGGIAVTECSSYLSAASKHLLRESISNQMVRSEYLVCDALGILGSRNITYQDAVHSTYGRQLAAKLDLRSFPSSLRRISGADKHTLNALFPGQIITRGNLAILDTPDWRFRLEVVASVRLDANKHAAWIVWLSDEAKTGNYRAYETLIIYNPNAGDRVTADVYPRANP